MRKWIKILLIVLGALVVVCAGLLILLYTTYQNVSADPAAAFRSEPNSSVVELSEATPAPVVTDSEGEVLEKKQDVVNILFLGVDSDAERVKLQKGYRADMILLVTVNFKTNTVNMLSVPRDTKVEMNKLDYTTGEVVSTTVNKINASYAFGGGPKHYGAQNCMDCVESFLSCSGRLDIPIDYYFSIDIDGIAKICDALGGVEVTLQEDFYKMTLEEGSGSKTLSSKWGSKGETITLKGDSAETFVRQRHVGGVNQRMSRQQQFMMACAKKIKSMGAASVAPKLFTELLTFSYTNLELNQVLALASFLDKFELDNIETYTVEGHDENSNKYWFIADEDALYNHLVQSFYATSSSSGSTSGMSVTQTEE